MLDAAASPLVQEIEKFLTETGMGPSYFGKKAVGNSEVVRRLREGRPIQTNTEAKIRAFIAKEKGDASV